MVPLAKVAESALYKVNAHPHVQGLRSGRKMMHQLFINAPQQRIQAHESHQLVPLAKKLVKAYCTRSAAGCLSLFICMLGDIWQYLGMQAFCMPISIARIQALSQKHIERLQAVIAPLEYEPGVRAWLR